MVLTLSLFALVFALGDLYAIYKNNHHWRYVFKPGTMLFIIGLAAYGLHDAGLYGWLILAGLLLSLAGDIFLVLPSDRFLQGLVSFFTAHVLYVSAFFLLAQWEWGTATVAAGPLVVIACVYAAILLPKVKKDGGTQLQIAVALYITVISMMVWLAFLTKSPWIMLGAALFFISDAILGWNRFASKWRSGDLAVMTAYFTGQYLIAVSMLA